MCDAVSLAGHGIDVHSSLPAFASSRALWVARYSAYLRALTPTPILRASMARQDRVGDRGDYNDWIALAVAGPDRNRARQLRACRSK